MREAWAAGNVGFDLQCVALATRPDRVCPTTSRTHIRGVGLTLGVVDPEGAARTPPPPGLNPLQLVEATSPRPTNLMLWLVWQSFRTVTWGTCQPARTPRPRVCPSPLPPALSVLACACHYLLACSFMLLEADSIYDKRIMLPLLLSSLYYFLPNI